MRSAPTEVTLELVPSARFDLIDVAARLRKEFGDFLSLYPRSFYCSYHTTAGYLEENEASRLHHNPDRVSGFFGVFRSLFPHGADYRHDRLELRGELSEEQRRVEPRNGDSHLTFIGAGLRNCVTYANRPDGHVFFVDLDGVDEGRARTRRTTVLGFHDERVVDRLAVEVPLSNHPIDSVNLRDPRLGLIDAVTERIRREGIERGSVEILLDEAESEAALTVNEYETHLMKHDLAEILANPLRFVAERGRHMLENPQAIPLKTRSYARYDFVQLFNELVDGLGVSIVERALARLIARPASRFLGTKRSVRLFVAGDGTIVSGPYQSPILFQWRHAARQRRRLRVVLRRFE